MAAPGLQAVQIINSVARQKKYPQAKCIHAILDNFKIYHSQRTYSLLHSERALTARIARTISTFSLIALWSFAPHRSPCGSWPTVVSFNDAYTVTAISCAVPPREN